jgi:ABC-2 type transport system ATP-binding protein
MPPIISVHNLRKTYGKTVAVDDISFEVAEGEIFGLLGPNGAGKTTTVECLQALRRPDSGAIRVLGFDALTESRSLRRRIGSQLQESALPDRIKVWEALDLFASVAPEPLDWRVLIDQWGLAEKRRAGFSSLSGGQRQRLFIALALVNNPKVVFLDEMTAGLDPAARRVAWDLIRSVREQGATVVLVTHFMDEVEHLCDRIAVFRDGRILATDSPSGLVNQYGTTRTVRFSTTAADLAWLSSTPCVASVEREGDQVFVHGEGAVLAHVAAALVARGIAPPDLRVDIPILEDVYMRLVERGA